MTNEEKISLSPIVEPLIQWFCANRRHLPWREDSTPYHIWLSEIMLQQTRIEAVIPYYMRFIARFPTVSDLAEASEDALLKMWEGLGYYSRARNLHKAAKLLSERGGAFPHTKAELLRLPGIGDYTAGAIASVGFGESEPAVDGNVLRVIARYTSDARTVTEPAYKKEITARLAEIYPTGEKAGLLTQGLMELGETLCIPNGVPLCENCPLLGTCFGYRKGTAATLPNRGEKKPRRAEERLVFLICCEKTGRYGIRKRPKTGLLASLYEFPNEEKSRVGDLSAYMKTLGLTPLSLKSCGDAKHLFTHIEWRLSGVKVCVTEESADFIWASPKDILQTYAIASAFRFYTDKITASLFT